MTDATNNILQQALSLSPIEKAALIEAVFKSFDRSFNENIDAAWSVEAEERIDAFDSGKLKADTAKNVIDRISQQ